MGWEPRSRESDRYHEYSTTSVGLTTGHCWFVAICVVYLFNCNELKVVAKVGNVISAPTPGAGRYGREREREREGFLKQEVMNKALRDCIAICGDFSSIMVSRLGWRRKEHLAICSKIDWCQDTCICESA